MNASVNLTVATDSAFLADVINFSTCIAANFDILRRRKINLSMTCESSDEFLATNKFVRLETLTLRRTQIYTALSANIKHLTWSV